MRCLIRNKTPFQYRTYLGVNKVQVGGLYTGVEKTLYSEPVTRVASISSARGNSQTEQFGTLEGYDKVIVTHENLPIDENSVINIENPISKSTEPYDYIVKRVAKTLNYTAIAIAKVKVS